MSENLSGLDNQPGSYDIKMIIIELKYHNPSTIIRQYPE